MGVDLSFDPADIDANGGTVRGWASSLDMFCARILGNSEDLSAQFDDSAKEFDEITGWNLEGASEEDRQAWRDAAGAVRYCAAVTEHWADNIDEFKQERNRLIGLWNDDKKDAEDQIAALGDANWFSSFFSDDKDTIIANLKEKLDEYNAQARTNWDRLMDHADDRKQELIDGPTPANIRSLIDAGYVNWSLVNIDPVQYAPEISPNEADEWGEKLSEAWKTGQRGEEYDNMMMMLNMLSIKIIEAGNRGTGADKQDQETLKSIYNAIGTHFDGLLNVPYSLDEIEESKEEQEEILGTLANGILVLSREDLEGGYENLPEDIRNALNSEHWYNGGEVSQGWGTDIEPMAAILEHSDDGLMGGKDFSALLTSIVGSAASSGFQHYEGAEHFNDNAGILLDVSTRNNEANHAILTNNFHHPDHRSDSNDNKEDYRIDAAEVVRGLLTHAWKDDGEIAANLFSWIDDYAESGNSLQQEMANEAFASTINLLTDYEEPKFEKGEIKIDKDSRFYQLAGIDGENIGSMNPYFSREFAKISIPFLKNFAEDPMATGPTKYEDGELVINAVDGLQFWMLTNGDSEAASTLDNSIQEYQLEQLGEMINGEVDPERLGLEMGNLRSLFDASVIYELRAEEYFAKARNTEALNDLNHHQNTVALAAGILKETIATTGHTPLIYGTNLTYELYQFGKGWIWGKPDEGTEQFEISYPITGSQEHIELNSLVSFAKAAETAGKIESLENLEAYSDFQEKAQEYEKEAGCTNGQESEKLREKYDELRGARYAMQEELEKVIGSSGLQEEYETFLEAQQGRWETLIHDPEIHTTDTYEGTVLQGAPPKESWHQ